LPGRQVKSDFCKPAGVEAEPISCPENFSSVGHPLKDLFASSDNQQTQVFCSRFPEPQAYHVNAQSLDWEGMFGYTMQQSIRGSSAEQHERLWTEFVCWCHPRTIDPSTAPVREVLGLLQAQVNRGLAFRTIGVYRSAISNFTWVLLAPLSANMQVSVVS
jgi:hypothetical protein